MSKNQNERGIKVPLIRFINLEAIVRTSQIACQTFCEMYCNEGSEKRYVNPPILDYE